jgi:hypothetical protein
MVFSQKSVEAGDPIEGYFPALISSDDFYRIQGKLKANSHYGVVGPVK